MKSLLRYNIFITYILANDSTDSVPAVEYKCRSQKSPQTRDCINGLHSIYSGLESIKIVCLTTHGNIAWQYVIHISLAGIAIS